MSSGGGDIEAIYLYGSYAGDNYDEDSDIDFAAVVKDDPIGISKKRSQVWADTNEMDLEFDIITSPVIISSKIFNEYKDEVGYYGNIFKEGIRLA